ncbi:MAG: replicative DNA helicase [Planctomycetota bacterium]|jgi:replicative DNA helicase
MDLIDRVPPQNLEAEASVLGAIMLDNQSVFDAQEKLRPEHFYKAANRIVYEVMLELTNRNHPVDLVILKDELTRRGQLEAIGGAAYLRELVETVPTAANISYYVDLVHDRALLRELIQVSTEIVKETYENEGPASEMLDHAEQKFFKVTETRVVGTSKNMSELITAEFAKIEAGAGAKGQPTHLIDLDRKTLGLKPAELTILAARPSMGKTSLATTIMRNVAVQDGALVVFFSLEVSANQVAQNMLCSHARVNSYSMRDGKLSRKEMEDLQRGAGDLFEAPIKIDDTAGLSIMELRARARKISRQDKIALIVVDYLQLMEGDRSRRSEGRQQEISQISRGLKQLARELNVPVVALSQLSRAVEQREGHRPRMSDLRESGSIEQDADMVWLLFREAYYKPDKPEIQNQAELIIAKNRNGPTGSVMLFFQREYTRFDNGMAV